MVKENEIKISLELVKDEGVIYIHTVKKEYQEGLETITKLKETRTVEEIDSLIKSVENYKIAYEKSVIDMQTRLNDLKAIKEQLKD